MRADQSYVFSQYKKYLLPHEYNGDSTIVNVSQAVRHLQRSVVSDQNKFCRLENQMSMAKKYNLHIPSLMVDFLLFLFALCYFFIINFEGEGGQISQPGDITFGEMCRSI